MVMEKTYVRECGSDTLRPKVGGGAKCSVCGYTIDADRIEGALLFDMSKRERKEFFARPPIK